MIRVKVGLIIVGFGETIADFGARVARRRRLRSYLYGLDQGVPYAPPVPRD